MSLLVIVALAAALAATVARWRAEHGALGLDGCVLAPTIVLLFVGIAATSLAVFRVLTPSNLAAAALTIAVASWPWRTRPVQAPARRLKPRLVAVLLLIGAGGTALRLLPHDYALAGRDQGTYTLRAEATARTGALDLHDALLATASAQAKRRSGPADIIGLLPTSGERWRKDRYEGAYRPGLYLADRATGHVVPQFFHLHPVLLACSRLAIGSMGPGALMLLHGVLGMLALAAVGARLWRRGPWMLLPPALLALSPLVIWVQRSALTEGPALLLLWGAALSALRARDSQRNALLVAALLLGGTAWVRGHGLLVAPGVAIALWSLPAHARTSAAVWGAMVLGAVMLHASTVYPYLHDELARMAPDLHPGPGQLVAFALATALAWDGAHRLRLARAPVRDRGLWPTRAPLLLALVCVVGVASWLALKSGAPPKPFARLDPLVPLVGPAVLLAAAIGMWSAARQRLPNTAANVWLAAIAVAMVVPIVLYARRNLPQGGLYYYGRYLVPELWPITALLATEAVRRLHARLSVPRIASLAATGAAAVLLGSTGLPLVTDPATRIREFSDARHFVEALAAAVPRNAVVIAGGEGWHHGHTFNQVGGALALSHGISVLPYRSREAAYATLHELLVEAPPGRPVYLLINEATKPYRLRDADGKPTGTKTAAFDSLLEAPFVAAEVRLLEMFVHRLTPVTDVLPTRVTRDELRMGLVRVEVDPTLAARVERFPPPGGTDPRCLHRKKKLKFKLPKPGPAGDGPVSIVIVASPGTSLSNATWHIKADGERLRTKVVGGRPRPRDTLGPFVVAKRPKKLVIRGAKRRHKRAPCPNGGVDEIRILPLTDPRVTKVPTTADSFAPARDLGHPIEPVNWVSGLGLSRARPGIVSHGGKLRAAGPSLVLGSGQTLTWPLQVLPDAGATPLDIVITLGKSEAGVGAQLALLWDGEVVATIEPPQARARSWQSEPIAVTPSGPTATFGVRLSGPSTGEVWVRDLGVFAHQSGTLGKLR